MKKIDYFLIDIIKNISFLKTKVDNYIILKTWNSLYSKYTQIYG